MAKIIFWYHISFSHYNIAAISQPNTSLEVNKSWQVEIAMYFITLTIRHGFFSAHFYFCWIWNIFSLACIW